MDKTKENAAGSFIKQGSILAAASILVRIIGLLYRIPMANILGDEGNGIYSAAFEIYNILLIISSYGMPLAVSKMVSARCVHGEYRSAYRIFSYALLFSVISGGVMALFVFFGANIIEGFSKYDGVAIPLRVLAPTIFIVAVMGVFRGLYQGKNTMIPTALSQVLEQIVNAFVSVVAAYAFMRSHSGSRLISAWGAAGGTLGTCMGALSALLLLLLIYALYRSTMRRQIRRDRVSDYEFPSEVLVIIIATIVPIILSQTVYQISGVIDLVLFSKVMDSNGYSSMVINTSQGIYSTKYRLLVSVPIAVSTAIASSMIPSMVASASNDDYGMVQKKAGTAVKFNMIIAFPSAVGLAVLGEPIVRLLFRGTDYMTGGRLLLLGSGCVIFYALSTVTSAVLQSIDRMRYPVYHSLVSLVIHIILVFFLLKVTDIGVYALMVGNVTYPLVVCILNGISVRKYLGMHQEVLKTFLVPFLSSAIMGALAFGCYQLLHLITHSNVISLVPAIAVAVVAYFSLVLLFQGLTVAELYEFPMGGRLVRIARKMHLIQE